MPANNFVFQEHLGSTESYFSKFPHTQNIIQIRVSDASHLQHAYEIKDFGSTRCWTVSFEPFGDDLAVGRCQDLKKTTKRQFFK